MAHIMVFVTDASPAGEGDGITVGGYARLSGMSPSDSNIPWSTEVNPSQLATAINEAIKDAAIAAAEAAEYTVGVLDKKTVFRGAMGL